MKKVGVKDKLGVEICEGDKIEITQRAGKYSSEPNKKWVETWEVFWSKERLAYELKREGVNYTPFMWSEIVDCYGECCCKVIK